MEQDHGSDKNTFKNGESFFLTYLKKHKHSLFSYRSLNGNDSSSLHNLNKLTL